MVEIGLEGQYMVHHPICHTAIEQHRRQKSHLRVGGAVKAGAERGQRGQDRLIIVALDRVEGRHTRHGRHPCAKQSRHSAQVHDAHRILQLVLPDMDQQSFKFL